MGEQNAPPMSARRWRHWWMAALLGELGVESHGSGGGLLAPEAAGTPVIAATTLAVDLSARSMAPPPAPSNHSIPEVTETSARLAQIVWYTTENVVQGSPAADFIRLDGADDFVFAASGDDTIAAGGGDDRVFGEAGNDELYGEAGGDRLEAGTGRDTLTGGDGNDTLSGGSEPDVMNGGAGDDLLLGGDGDDLLLVGSGNDTLVGGAGWDRVWVGRVSGETRFASRDGFLELEKPDGVDAVVEVERIDFLDGSIRFDTTNVAAQVFRVYAATLGRAPDALGLGGWTKAIEAGGSGLAQVVSGFVASAEFQARYGAPDAGAFVSLLYANVLGRSPDPGGFAAWTGAISSGMAREAAVLGFSEAPEHVLRTAGAIGAGLWVVDQSAVDALRCYLGVLGRLPDPAGLAGWTAARNAGLGLPEMAQGFINSTEFQAATSNLSTRDYVTYLYGTTLGRAPDGPGLATWSNALDSNQASRFDLAFGFIESLEMTLQLSAYVQDGIMIG